MSNSSPSDLATTFRSLPRRVREAGGESPTDATRGTLDEIGLLVGRAGTLVHVRDADPMAVADAIEAVPASGWGPELDELRAISLELGRHLRALAAAADHDPG
jgi:hypothetical protein